MAEIKAADVAKLRKITGAGMMDCKVALEEANGDFDVAIDILRKKGQRVANKRADREATEGAVIAKVSADSTFGVLISLNCETDFVAKNDDFVKTVHEFADLAIAAKAKNLDEVKALPYKDHTIGGEVMSLNGVIGEKIDISVYEVIEAQSVTAYIHPGNKVASLAGFNKADLDMTVRKDVVMQIAAMAPIAIDKADVPQNVIDKEIEIGKEIAVQEGKPAEMAEKIAVGKLNRFFQENTLNNQAFIKDNKITVQQYLSQTDKDLKVVAFRRNSLMV